jgi:ATP-dependent DNA ligase
MYSQELVDKFYPGATIFEAMEVWKLPKHKKDRLEKICNEGKYFAQLKKDGNWYEFNKTAAGVCYLFSRGTSVKTNLPVESIHNVPHLSRIFKTLPNDTVLIGEIYYPNQDTNAVRSIMGCLPKKAVERQKDAGYIHFYLHDILKLNGEILTSQGAYQRYNILQEVISSTIGDNPFVEVAPIVTENIYNFVIEAFANQEEGTVLKLKTGEYAEGKRPAWSMIKVKKEDTVDVVCMGFEDPTIRYEGQELKTWQYWVNPDSGKMYPLGNYYDKYIEEEVCMFYAPVTKPFYFGWKTSLQIGVYKNNVLTSIGTVSSGLTDELKEDLSKNPDQYIGRTIECQCMEITKDSLRHPIFLRFRNDKQPTSCTFESVFSA